VHSTAKNVHLSAVEHKENIVFLHAVQDGPASQSYGLQVAQLAGVPAPVIRAARKHLAELEAHSVSNSPQFDLFASAPEIKPDSDNERLQQAFEEIDPDSLSPREALEALYQLKKLIQP
jgi:DNA mismatch repair protein MutS